MNIKEAAVKWHCSKATVQKYCKDGLIPSAYKEKNRWVINDDFKKPPLTAYRFVILLKNIEVIQEGAKLDMHNFSTSKKDLLKAYKYLSDNGFISHFDLSLPLQKSLNNVTITKRGKELIAIQMKNYPKLSGKFSLNLGIVNIEIAGNTK